MLWFLRILLMKRKMQCKEMKLGEVFTDKDIIKNKSGDSIIVNKEYTAHIVNAEGFKTFV